MATMKCLHEAIQDAKRVLAQDQPFSNEELTSLFESVGEIARHGNAGLSLFARELFDIRTLAATEPATLDEAHATLAAIEDAATQALA